MDLFVLDRTVFDQKIAELRNVETWERPYGTYPVLCEAIALEEEAGEGNGFDPDQVDSGESDYLGRLMYELQILGVLCNMPGSPGLHIESAVDTGGYRQISVGGHLLPHVYLAGGSERACNLTDGTRQGVEGVWAAAEAAVREANRILGEAMDGAAALAALADLRDSAKRPA